MRFLAAGHHCLRVWTEGSGALERVSVRRVPELSIVNFLYNPRTGDPYGGLAIFGYDPVASKLTFWHFENSGLVGQSRITKQDDSIWQLKGGGYGKEGAHSWTSTLVRLGKRKLEEKDFRVTVAGETKLEPDSIWVKEPAKQKK